MAGQSRYAEKKLHGPTNYSALSRSHLPGIAQSLVPSKKGNSLRVISSRHCIRHISRLLSLGLLILSIRANQLSSDLDFPEGKHISPPGYRTELASSNSGAM